VHVSACGAGKYDAREIASRKDTDSAPGFDGRYLANTVALGFDGLVETQHAECTNEDHIISGWRKAVDDAPNSV
jgi:hypothetical protein